MQNKDYSGSNNYLGKFRVLSDTCQKKPLSGPEKRPIDIGDIVMLIGALESEHPGRVDKENSKMIIGDDESERVYTLDLSTEPFPLLTGYSLVINKNLEVNIKNSSEGCSYNLYSEPSFIRPGIKGTFMFYPLSSKKEKPSKGLINHVENIFRGYYSKKFKDS